MKSDEPFTHPDAPSRPRRGGNGLFYFEGVGPRLNLRFTRLAVALVVLFTVIPVSALFILFLSRADPAETKVDVNVRTIPPASALTPPLIKQSPPPTQRIRRAEPLPSAPPAPATALADPMGDTNRGVSAAPSPNAVRKD